VPGAPRSVSAEAEEATPIAKSVVPPAEADRGRESGHSAVVAGPPLAFRGTAAPSLGYTSLDRIFASGKIQPEAHNTVASGIKLALLSLAGGVGKTTLAVTLARILSGKNKQVVVGDFGLYPTAAHHFGSRGKRIGALQLFFPPCRSAPMPVAIFNQPLEEMTGEDFQQLLEQVNASDTALLMDLPTLQGPVPGEAVGHADHVLVPVTPDLHSLVAAIHLEEMLSAFDWPARRPQVHYAINRFSDARPLHREVRGRLEQLLGAKLLPVVLHEDQTIEEAAARGVTVVDDCPESPAVEEFTTLANWVCSLSNGSQMHAKEGFA
jgi:cellulose biosynthesis protein BcsQ